MISELAFTFVMLPCIAAVMIAALVSDWRLAAAAFFGGLAFAFAAPSLPPVIGLIGLPVALGIAIGGAVTAVQLRRRDDTDIWSRMLATLVVTFAAAFTNLLFIGTGA